MGAAGGGDAQDGLLVAEPRGKELKNATRIGVRQEIFFLPERTIVCDCGAAT
jgi:hypothetical protein